LNDVYVAQSWPEDGSIFNRTLESVADLIFSLLQGQSFNNRVYFNWQVSVAHEVMARNLLSERRRESDQSSTWSVRRPMRNARQLPNCNRLVLLRVIVNQSRNKCDRKAKWNIYSET
jgi:hypothetical protein